MIQPKLCKLDTDYPFKSLERFNIQTLNEGFLLCSFLLPTNINNFTNHSPLEGLGVCAGGFYSCSCGASGNEPVFLEPAVHRQWPAMPSWA